MLRDVASLDNVGYLQDAPFFRTFIESPLPQVHLNQWPYSPLHLSFLISHNCSDNNVAYHALRAHFINEQEMSDLLLLSIGLIAIDPLTTSCLPAYINVSLLCCLIQCSHYCTNL